MKDDTKREERNKTGGTSKASGTLPFYILSVSYGNDSIALIQWAHEYGLENCFAVYCDTGWAHPEWPARVREGMTLAESYGFVTWSVKGMTFEEIVLMKKGFPSQKFQWCSGLLKTIPFGDFAEFIDPNKEAVIIIGKRRVERKIGRIRQNLVLTHNTTKVALYGIQCTNIAMMKEMSCWNGQGLNPCRTEAWSVAHV